MSLAVHGLGAVLGWTALMLLSYAPGPVPTVALIIALAGGVLLLDVRVPLPL